MTIQLIAMLIKLIIKLEDLHLAQVSLLEDSQEHSDIGINVAFEQEVKE